MIGKCATCRFNGTKCEIEEAPLPVNRIKTAKAFEVTGVDLTDPVDTSERAESMDCPIYLTRELFTSSQQSQSSSGNDITPLSPQKSTLSHETYPSSPLKRRKLQNKINVIDPKVSTILDRTQTIKRKAVLLVASNLTGRTKTTINDWFNVCWEVCTQIVSLNIRSRLIGTDADPLHRTGETNPPPSAQPPAHTALTAPRLSPAPRRHVPSEHRRRPPRHFQCLMPRPRRPRNSQSPAPMRRRRPHHQLPRPATMHK
ncbi:hypothetical protein ILUMI_04840 [Ignelater luminosus]|uniref:Uncharacterized protein n=1 Tax=Ignelater luminosus TaxID=2038154 RepID=A0A8K0GKQ9_IGNLU|nr:hypothetical protein ILUMI_04840 [Ignelater luminosus]